MTTQSEAGQDRDPFRCTDCDGYGRLTVLDEKCRHGGQNCPCDTFEIDCPHCYAGVIPCEWCAENPATLKARTPPYGSDSLICQSCQDEHDEPSGDHPMGGMGHQRDYETYRQSLAWAPRDR